MKRTDKVNLRRWILGLCLASLAAGFLIANINTLDVSLIYLGLFMVVIGVGLMTNLWGGLAASAIAVFALILLNRYVSIYPIQNRVVNVAIELAIFLAAGPLAGWLAQGIENHQAQIDHWIIEFEQRSIREDHFDTLKPEWSRIRLNEEVLRARTYSRPLSVAMLQFANIEKYEREERIAAILALVRITRSSAPIPAVVSYSGENRLLMILPEQSRDQAQSLIREIQNRVQNERYFPIGSESLGEPLARLGTLLAGVSTLGPENDNVDALLGSAMDGLKG